MSILSFRKRRNSSKHGGRSFAFEFYNALQEHEVALSKIFLDGELVTDFASTPNQTQVHFGLSPDGNLKSICFRLNYLPLAHISILQQILTGWNSLTDLRFEHCNLTYKQLLDIQVILEDFPHIINLSINGNPGCFESHSHREEAAAIPLRNSQLKTYCLVMCKLQAQHLQRLSYALSKPDRNSRFLSYLNLSCNKINDEGCLIFASVLRTNRTLQALNISDNLISADALCHLLASCRKFQLSTEEINYKRQIKLMHGMKDMLDMKWSLVSWMDSAFLPNEPQHSTYFVNDVHLEDGAFYSSGNNTLLHLNISYNEITKDLMEYIIDTIKYQKSTSKTTGLIRIVLEGKEKFPALEEEIQKLLSNIPESNRNSRSSRRANSIV